MLRKGTLRAEKIAYPDGIGCCIWHVFPNSDSSTEDMGICWDFEFEHIDELIALLQELKDAPAESYEEPTASQGGEG